MSSPIATTPHNTTDLPVPQPLMRDQSCLAGANSDNFKNEGASSSSSFIMCHGRRLWDERRPYHLSRKDINNPIR